MSDKDGIIRKGDMFDYCAYRCDARNFSIGIWYNGRMYGIREKFGDRYIDYENHWDDGPEGHGTCKPITRLTGPLSARLAGHMFDIGNWRGHTVLMDMLYALESMHSYYFGEAKTEQATASPEITDPVMDQKDKVFDVTFGGEKLKLKGTEFQCGGANMIIASNGGGDGDWGHGGRTYFCLENGNMGMFDNYARLTTDDDVIDADSDGFQKFEIVVGGRWESEALRSVFKHAYETLDKLMKEYRSKPGYNPN